MTHCDTYYKAAAREQGIAGVDIAKQGAGSSGTFNAAFSDKYTRFGNLPLGSTSTSPHGGHDGG